MPRAKSDALRPRDNGPVHLTKDGLEKLKEELSRVKKSLPRLIAEAQRTAAYGDRSDNAEYSAAKGALRRANWKILEIQDRLKRVVIIETGKNKSGTVQLGSTVVVEVEGEKKTFRILGPAETDPSHGRISHVSPLGAALLSHKEGDDVMLQTPRGFKTYRIIQIE